MGKRWAAPECAEDLFRLVREVPSSSDDDPDSEFHEWYVPFLVAAIAGVPAKGLWPEILDLARLPGLGLSRGTLLARAGRFTKHPEQVLGLLGEYVDDPLAQVRHDVARGVRALRDPRGIALLETIDSDPILWVRQESRRARKSVTRVSGNPE